MRYTSQSLAFHFDSLVSLKAGLTTFVLAAAILVASVVQSPAQVRELPDGTVELAVEPAEFDIEAALERLEDELGFSMKESQRFIENSELLEPLVNSAEYTAVFLYTQRNDMLRAEAAKVALQAVMAEEQLRAEVQKLQLQNGTVIPMDEYNELQGAYYAMEEELTLLQGDYQVLHVALEQMCVGLESPERFELKEACSIVLGVPKDETN